MIYSSPWSKFCHIVADLGIHLTNQIYSGPITSINTAARRKWKKNSWTRDDHLVIFMLYHLCCSPPLLWGFDRPGVQDEGENKKAILKKISHLCATVSCESLIHHVKNGGLFWPVQKVKTTRDKMCKISQIVQVLSFRLFSLTLFCKM